jgi:hypothetical protein
MGAQNVEFLQTVANAGRTLLDAHSRDSLKTIVNPVNKVNPVSFLAIG